ncbi:sulfate ABC transporter ATP-binding protein [Desulfoluna limicola]|uniref:Sulfate ABC transporter ATP-binding protein n=1 Tax=Desulfoluna limicola TaxID=2810562 RepID=A0ABN6F874_9BACT|nr:ATP-binding cassette domain-containing protein [Desulfoluna limicola]BCS97642.1 sulfate ABC transporter ATP-binding protein [Desulfoluna limicola]
MTLELAVSNLSIQNGAYRLCEDLSFSVAPQEVVTIMGPSGSGKSTILSWISGALGPDFKASGTVSLGGRTLTGLPIEKRGIAILFQDDLLFPHMTVLENLLFALPAGERKARKKEATQVLADLGLNELKNRRPKALSGGQKARISLMRALLSRPDAVLLDEPFSKLDKPLRKSFRAFVFETIRTMGIPAILVTHDEDDIPEDGRLIRLDE